MARNKSNWASRNYLKSVSEDRSGWSEQMRDDRHFYHLIAPNGKVVEIKLQGGKYVIDFDGDRIGRPSGYAHCADAMIEAEKLVCK